MRALIIATPGGSMIQNSGSTVVLACGVRTPIRPRGAYASDTVETPHIRCDLAPMSHAIPPADASPKNPAPITRTDTDVLISGGGPVGLCLALLLAEQQIDVTVIEQDSEIVRDLPASTFHPPTLDMLEQLGVTQHLIARGLPFPARQVRI